MKRLVVVGLLLAVALAAGISLFASSAPDGLEKVAADHGIAAAERESAAAGSPLADYTLSGADGSLPAATAGLLGVAATAAIGFAFFRILRGRQS